MKRQIQKVGVVVTALTIATMLTSGSVSAWGPARPTYTMKDPAEHATFNSITDNAAIGDERDFVRVAEKKADGSAYYRSDITVEPGKEYEVFIYYHNDASATYNDEAHDYVGVSRGTRVSSMFPTELKKGEKGKIVGRISSETAEPALVWDEAYITATEDMTLHYVLASAKIYNRWGTSGSGLSTNLFSDKGTFIGSSKLTGLILGCDEYAGQVLYTIRTKAVEKPVEPTPEEPEPEPEPEPDPEVPTPDPEIPEEPDVPTVEPEPETPTELPKTGAHEAVLAVIVIVALLAGVIYWRKTSHAVRKATRHAKGRK